MHEINRGEKKGIEQFLALPRSLYAAPKKKEREKGNGKRCEAKSEGKKLLLTRKRFYKEQTRNKRSRAGRFLLTLSKWLRLPWELFAEPFKCKLMFDIIGPEKTELLV